MSKEKLIGCLLMVLMSFSGCKKTTEKVIDCFGDSLLISLHVTVSAANAKEVAAEVKYLGTKKVSGVKWEYGDGGIESSASLTSKHTYTSAGTYIVKARVTFTEGKSSCEVDPTKSVIIQ